ncbi:MAG: hypothetical protein ACLU45_02030 [Dialister invisus]|uniref:hypothetical protein n=1 Tax=Dialister invisus TaxID=218538 RepID=UPI003999BB7C
MDTKEQKTIDTKAEITDIQIIEPQILSADLSITTNFEDVKNNLQVITEKYKGLVVTDQNQKGMEKRSGRWCLSGRVFKSLKSTGNGSSANLLISLQRHAKNF